MQSTIDRLKSEIANDNRGDRAVRIHDGGDCEQGLYVRFWITKQTLPTARHEALVYELEASGYQVMDGEAPAGRTTISGDIVRVYCDAYFTYDGEVTLRIEAAKAGESVFQASYTGTGSAGMNWAGTGDSYSQSLSMALQSALRQFIADLDQHEM